MPDKQPHQPEAHKKPSKSLKEQRAAKKARRAITLDADPVAHLRKPRSK
ncbi:hypothetical protein RBS60_17500 [Sinomonas sp. ASV486]|uniref:Uncharacterized protein n=1 Tax=Sinomonas puerhi TaxID=3238584 RepID=A0AB39L5K6_9MICC|nr:hypothetical protein [Sinomonas sp. ASV486]MDQ4491173.1 hypothetical protein [Sinomonas sp. ASV486]MDQ4491833.1 hypothetical protein [Sinomonas sp. ASV486]MDQ4491999.1 hypothetical protein [Sinomonas sp. ASV486]